MGHNTSLHHTCKTRLVYETMPWEVYTIMCGETLTLFLCVCLLLICITLWRCCGKITQTPRLNEVPVIK